VIAEEFKRETEYCTFCPKMCRFVCPTAIAENRETVTPTGRQTLLYLIQRGGAELDSEAAAVFHQCTGCGLCTEYCDHDIEVYPVMLSARAAAVKEGIVLPQTRHVLDNYLQYGNPYGNLLPAYLNKVGQRLLREAQIFYVPDVTAVARNQASLDATLRVLEKLGAENVALWPGPMLCSGYNLHALGFEDEFRAHAVAFAEVAAGARTLVFASPHDALTVTQHYPEHGVKLDSRVITESEWLDEMIGKRQIASQTQRRVLYHDPCAQGRGLGQYEAPRRIITRINGVAPLEFSWNRNESKCCGWGGGYAFTVPESAKVIARQRIEEAVEETPDEIVTASPSCAGQLQAAGSSSVPVYDLMSWLAMRLS
jgi:Fe-S oxidoreductase